METSRARSVPQIIGIGHTMGHQWIHLKHAQHSVWSLRAFWGPAGGITKAVIFYVPGPVLAASLGFAKLGPLSTQKTPQKRVFKKSHGRST